MFGLDWYVIAGIIVVGIVLAAVVVLPALFNKSKQELTKQFKEIQFELQQAMSQTDSQVMQLKLQKVASRLDNFIGKLLKYYNYSDPSVNQQIRRGMEAKLYTYEEFKVLKAFHLMRNQIIHEDRMVYQDDVNTMYQVIEILRKLL